MSETNKRGGRAKKKYVKHTPVYVKGYKYRKIKELSKGWRVKCTNTEGGEHCTGRGYYLDTGILIQKPKERHSGWCFPKPHAEDIDSMKENFKNEVSHSNLPPKTIFYHHVDELMRKCPDVQRPSYASFKNITTYAKQKVNPPQPEDLRAMAEYLWQDQYKTMLKYNWRGSSQLSVEMIEISNPEDGSTSVSVLFADGAWIDYVLSFIEHTVDLFSDGTFSIKPAKLKSMQVFKIEASCFYRGTPLAYALMEHRTANDYEAVIRCLVNKYASQLKEFKVKIHCDFEKAEEIGWRRVIPSAIFILCFFHYENIHWRNGKRFKLFKTKKSLRKPDDKLTEAQMAETLKEKELLKETENALRLILNLPHLPDGYMVDHKLMARLEGRLRDEVKERMVPYFKYVNKNWVNNEKNPPEKWNVSGEPHKTNNFSETGNRLMRGFFPEDHPQPWTFVKSLVSYHDTVASGFGVDVGKASLTRENTINSKKALLLSGKIQRVEFLEEVSKVTCRNMQVKFREAIDEAVRGGTVEDREEAEEEDVHTAGPGGTGGGREKQDDDGDDTDDDDDDDEEEGEEVELIDLSQWGVDEGEKNPQEGAGPDIEPLIEKYLNEMRCEVQYDWTRPLVTSTTISNRKEEESASCTNTNTKKRPRKQILTNIERDGGVLEIQQVFLPSRPISNSTVKSKVCITSVRI